MKYDQYKAMRLTRKLNEYKAKLVSATTEEIGDCLKMIKLYEDALLALDL